MSNSQSAVLHDRTHTGTRRIGALTGIRGIAALWVVAFHLATVADIGGMVKVERLPVLRSGNMGVDLFFILSGFVLMLTYGRSLERPSWHATRDFWIGRCFRILPLHWFVLAVLLGLYLLLGDGLVMTQRHDAMSFVASVFLVQGWLLMPKSWNLPAWSLSAEWLAYTLFPLAVMIAIRVRTRTMAVALAVAAWLVLTGVCVATHDVSLSHIRTLGLLRCLAEFPIGMLTCRIWQMDGGGARLGVPAFYAGCVLLAIALAGSGLDLAAIPAFTLIILGCACQVSVARRLLGNRVVVFLGDISFSIYLLHWLIIELLADAIVKRGLAGAPAAACLVLGFVAVVPLAWLTWRLIEVPAQARGRDVVRAFRERQSG